VVDAGVIARPQWAQRSRPRRRYSGLCRRPPLSTGRSSAAATLRNVARSIIASCSPSYISSPYGSGSPQDGFDAGTRDVDDRLLKGSEHGILFGARKEPAHHRFDLAAREFDADLLGDRRVREALRQPTHLPHERAAKVGMRPATAL